MRIFVPNPVEQTIVIAIIVVAILIVSLRLKRGVDVFPLSVTNELKGLAVLLVIFSHIGYFLSQDTRFLVPLSNYAGVGVDLFLFLSGLGLTLSSLKKQRSIIQFYVKRLLKVMIPLWCVIGILLLCDALFLGRVYNPGMIAKNIFAFFPHADLYADIDSPLWFITIIVFYYLLFPLVFVKRAPWLTALFLFISGFVITRAELPVTIGVASLYKLHIIAFPLGIAAATIIQSANFKRWHSALMSSGVVSFVSRVGIYALCVGYFVYSSAYPAVGSGVWHEQFVSCALAIALIIIALVTKLESRALVVLGMYSFEIYLLHWPIIYRYDFLYRFFPASVATLLYLPALLGIAYLLHVLIERFMIRTKSHV